MSYALDSPPKPLDSPSKQLFLDLARDFEQFHLYASDIKKAKVYERRSYYDSLDRLDRERAAEHNTALDKVAANHSRVREEAEETLRKHLIAEEERRLRKEEEARRERERVERQRAEKLRREQEEAAQKEAERKAKEEERRRAEAEAEKTHKAAEDERKRREQEERRKREEDAQKAERETALRKAQKAQADRQKQVGGGRQTEEETRIQLRYVELHQQLKKFRQWLKDEGRNNPTVKQSTGDIRRSIKKCVGQLRGGKGANKPQLQEIKSTLDKAASISEPSVDIRTFLAFPPEHIASSDDTKVPALLIYGFNILVKSIISSLITEASLHPTHAEPIGIVAAHIFSADTFIYKGVPMSDILWAKYRVVCPALWGFYGDQKTAEGMRALGWWREDDSSGSGGSRFISEQGHVDRMTALGAGFSALTLRNFGKTARRNPFPNTIFWHAMHKILSIPLAEVQETHVTLLAAVLRSSAERVLGFFGAPGMALLRRAIVDIPRSRAEQTMAVHELKLLRELYWRDKNILL
ncbi:hypothetical protein PHISP_04334 [Aspergillus sp. HF37]|nr:hypothetical protein PHISP_04334 [Aspergillus sp. HF37]